MKNTPDSISNQQNKQMAILKSTLSSVLFAVLLVGIVPNLARAGDFEALYVFGDSLNDPGNASAITSGTFPLPSIYPVNRFSNGPVTSEYLARLLEVPSRPFYADPRGTNFAVGGATTGILNFNFAINSPFNFFQFPELGTSGIYAQILDALVIGPTFKPNNTLFYVSGGGNDIFLSLALYPTGAGLSSALAQAIQNQIAGISLLASHGARNFVVPNLPNLGATPVFSGTPLAGPLTAVTSGYNSALAAAMTQLETQLGKKVKIKVFDTYSLGNEILQSPEKFGLTNITTSCLGDGQEPACTGYFFYDGVHPTTAGHRILARKINKMLED